MGYSVRPVSRPLVRGVVRSIAGTGSSAAPPTIVSQTLLADGVTIRCVGSVPLTAGDTVGLTRSVGTITSASVVGGNLDIVVPKSYAGDSLGTLTYDGTGTLAGATGAVAAFGPVAITNSSGFGTIFTGASALWHDFRTGVVPTGYTYSCSSAVRRWSPSTQQYVEVPANTFVEDYDPATGECLGYLSEGAATNLCLYSAEDGAAWAATNATKGSGASLIAGKTATSITQTGAAGYIAQTVGTFTASNETCAAIIERGANAAVSQLVVWDATSGAAVSTVEINWSAETVTETGTGTVYNEAFYHGPNGGRAVRVATAGYTGTSGNTREIRIVPDTAAANAVLYRHHTQLVSGTRVTSPTVTLGSTVNRAATSLFTAAIPGWYDPAQVTQFADIWLRQSADTYSRALIVNDNSYNDNIGLSVGASGDPVFHVFSASVVQAWIPLGAGVTGSQRMAGSAKLNEFRFALNASAGAENNSGLMPATTLTRIFVGASTAGDSPLTGHIRRIGIAPVTQTTAQLQELTA